MATKRLLPIAALIALLVSSCSPYQLVNSEVYNNADMSSYKTFRIVSPEQGHLPPGMEMVTYYNIAAAIREQMVDRGFTEDQTSPLLVNIAVTTRREISTEPAIPPGYMPYYGPYYPYWMYPRYNYWTNYYSNAQVITGIYKEGVLTMDMVNIDDKLPLYSSSVATIIDNGGSGPSQYRNLEAIAQAVEVLFSKFPVPLLPQYRGK